MSDILRNVSFILRNVSFIVRNASFTDRERRHVTGDCRGIRQLRAAELPPAGAPADTAQRSTGARDSPPLSGTPCIYTGRPIYVQGRPGTLLLAQGRSLLCPCTQGIHVVWCSPQRVQAQFIGQRCLYAAQLTAWRVMCVLDLSSVPLMPAAQGRSLLCPCTQAL